MAGALKTALNRVAIAIVLAALGGLGWLILRSDQYVIDAKEEEWRALHQSLHYHAKHKSITASDAAIYVSEEGMRQAVNLINGTKIIYKESVRSSDYLEIEIKYFDPSFKSGFPSGKIRISANSPSKKIRIDLEGEATLIFSDFSRHKDGRTIAKFSVRILRLKPDLGWSIFRISVRGFASDLIARGIAVSYAEKLQVAIPLPEVKFDIERTMLPKVPVREPKDANWIDLELKLSGPQERFGVSYSYPRFIDGGLWLSATERAEGQAELPKFERGSPPASQLDTEIAEARKSLAAVARPVVPQGAHFLLWVNGRAFESGIGRIAALPPNQRTVAIRSKAVSGHLAETKWFNKILGKGGTVVDLYGVNAIKGSLLVSSIAAQWSENGLKFQGQVQASGNATIKLHVDPLVGGGASTVVQMDLETANIDASGSAQLSSVAIGQRRLWAAFPTIECRPAVLTARTDGKLKFDWGWTKVLSVGAKISLPGLAGFVQPVPLLTDRPFVVRGRIDGRKAVPINGTDFQALPAWEVAEFALIPGQASMTRDGIAVSGQFAARTRRIESTEQEQQRTMEADKEEEDLKRAFAEQYRTPECPGQMEIAVLLGNTEFGTNNDFIKLAKNAWNDLTKGPGGKNEAVRIMKAANDAASAAGEALDDTAKRAIAEAEGLANRTFGPNSEAARIARQLAQSIFPQPAPSASLPMPSPPLPPWIPPPPRPPLTPIFDVRRPRLPRF
ncbi:MAG: hypothetical protein J0J10_09400 [Bosea sp.]|uniref:hypothetical protein n=1 Tax=Bosea sp. (in: a-proteobacteria) TaxID=1871050 RepID=UPI001AD5CC0C|nr:hypothetical protein [Bosea sp. (in: a-proteobacteria)]MBN9468974.1 hypothetical protein [Bosea sp. (in: a-proteobacteria)]